MNSDMILTWSTVILTTITLIVYFKIRSRNNEKNIFSALQYFAIEHNGAISSYNHWDNTLIGIDKKENGKLFFLRTTPSKLYREVINLAEVTNCHLHKKERTTHYNDDKVTVIDKIELIFSFVDTKKPDIALEFYNTDYDNLTLDEELKLAQKWTEEVKSIVNKNQESKGKQKVFENRDDIKPQAKKVEFVKNKKENRHKEKEFAF